jgi:hypothetical protein
MKTVKLIILAALLSSCSVYMAAEKKGVELETLMACSNRACFMGLRDTELVESRPWDDGGEQVIFRSLKPQGSTGRAVMHGLLDVATLGIWEVAGTPIEGNYNDEEFVIYTAFFDANGVVQRVILNAASS